MDNQNNAAAVAEALESIKAKQAQIKLIEAEVALLRDVVTDYLDEHGVYQSETVKAIMTEPAVVVTYDKNAINAIIKGLEMAIDVSHTAYDTRLSAFYKKYYDELIAARRETNRESTLRISFKI